MSKRKFRSTALQDVDWTNVREKLKNQPVVVAVDVAKIDFYATLMTPDRQMHVILRWKHPLQTRALVETLQAQLAGMNFVVVMEPTGTYGDPLLDLLHQARIPVYRAAPNRTNKAAELYDGVPSMHDAKACYVIGRLHLENNTERWIEPTAQQRELKAELKLLEMYQERSQRSLNRLEALLARHWPEAPHILSLDSVTLLQTLAHYGSPAAVRAAPEEALQLMCRTGRSGLKPETSAQLLASAETTIGRACEDAERYLLQTLAEDLLAQRLAIRELERRLEARLADDEMLSRLHTVVGRVTALMLLAELGSPQDYPSAAHYLKALGLNLKERSSGKHKGQLKITKRGPSVARRYLYWAALRWLKHNRVVKHWAEAKAQRDGGSKSKAITAIMRKLVRALWHVGRGAIFDPNRLFNVAALPALKAA